MIINYILKDNMRYMPKSYPDYTMDEIAKIADDKMYEMKTQHYKSLQSNVICDGHR